MRCQKNYIKNRFVFVLTKYICAILFSIIFFSGITFGQSYYDYELKKINFSGNDFLSESELKSNIESKESPAWYWIFLNSIYSSLGDERVFFDSSNISIDVLAIKELYRSNGFFSTKIKHYIEPDTANKTIAIFFDIDEGVSLNYGKVNLYGLDKLEEYEKMINKSITMDSSKRYLEFEVQNNISAIRKFLANSGYIFGGYDSTIIKIDTVYKYADVNVYFHSGDKYIIGKTIVNRTGTSVEDVSAELVNEIAGLKSGIVYDQSVIERSELRLLKTELFNSVNVNPIISDTISHLIPVEINAVIGSLNELSPDIKADNEFNSFNFGVGIGYTRKNFLGDARKFSVSTSARIIDIPNFNFSNIFKSPSKRDSTYQGVLDFNIKMEQPFLFGKPILTTTDLYLRFKTNYDNNKSLRYEESNYGITQKFDIEMPAYTFITLFRPFINVDIAEQGQDFDINYEIDDTLKRISVSVSSFSPSFGIELGSSKTNDILFPTEGNYFYLTPEIFHSRTSYKISGVTISNDEYGFSFSGSAYFYRIQSGLSSYYSLNKEKTSIIASKLRLGYVQPFTASNSAFLSSENLIPPNKTFYAGGSNSVRAWRSKELVPQSKVKYSGAVVDTSVIRGGTFWLEGSFEFRKRIGENFGYALFTDYGNTWNGWKVMQIKDIAVAVGLGIRIYTPIAPFRLDFAAKFYDPFDNKTIFKKQFLGNILVQFGIGEAF